MSDVWLFLAIGSLFLAIVLVGVFIDQTIAERHRAVRLLESQVTAGGQAAPRVDLDSVLDPGFTAGMDPNEYLRKMHEGELG